MTDITIYDACCGSGKSTRIINELSKLPDNQKVIVVVPLLSETHRYAGTNLIHCIFGSSNIHNLKTKKVLNWLV